MRRVNLRAQTRYQLVFVGKVADFVFREHSRTIDNHVEDAAGTFNQLHLSIES